jgi:transposase
MAREYRPVDRDQQFLMPPSLREWLPPDHLVWFVLDVVDQLDTGGFHAGNRLGGRGRRAFDPDMLLGVLLYAYAVGERSSRRIELLCGEHVAFQVLCGRDVPDHTVISRFRALHEDRFAELFGQVLVLCARAGMGKLGMVAIDGTKIAANASILANRGEESLRAQAERIARRISKEAEEVDAAEDELYGDASGDELAPEFANPSTLAAAIKAALAELEAEKKRQAEKTAEKAAEEAERRAQSWQQRAGTPVLNWPVPSGRPRTGSCIGRPPGTRRASRAPVGLTEGHLCWSPSGCVGRGPSWPGWRNGPRRQRPHHAAPRMPPRTARSTSPTHTVAS